MAQPVVREVVAATPPPPRDERPVVAQTAPQPPLPSFLEMWKEQQKQVAQVQAPVVQQQQQGQQTNKPKREPWIIKPTDISIKPEGQGNTNGGKEGKEPTKEQKDAFARTGASLDLIKHATWARPASVCKTLYMSQRLPGRTLDAINSDEPGITRVATTIPIFDKETRTCELLPKGSIALIQQEGKPVFGQQTLTVKLLQIEPPGRRGEVITFRGDVADEQGSGLRGNANNHWGRFAVAALINLGTSLGLNSIGGTPGRGEFYQDPVQQAGREAAQSATNDVRKLSEAQLKVPPTITKPAGALVEIQLLDNVTFIREPLVVK